MSILSDLGAFLLGIGSATLNFLKGAALALSQNPQLQEIAKQEVQNVEDAAIAALASGSVTTGVQKLAQAQAGVLQKVAEAGTPVVMQQVNLAIECAVANLTAEKAAQTPAAQ